MSTEGTIHPVMDSFGCISQFLTIRRDIASLRREQRAIRDMDRIDWIPGGMDRGKSTIGRLIAYGRKILFRP
jgi:hypothetical protein